MDPVPMTTLKKAISTETDDAPIKPEHPYYPKASREKRSSIALMEAADNKKGCCAIF